MFNQTRKTNRLALFALILAASLSASCNDGHSTGAVRAEKPAPAGSSALQEPSPASQPEQPQAVAVDYRDIKWEELIPKEDLDALLNPPDYLATIAEGSDEDTFPAEEPLTIDGPASAAEARYQQALKSTKIKPEFDRQQVRIPGFVVPLEFDENQTITSFLLVPYFGACMHLPPPPPNQVIYVDHPQGVEVEFLYDAFHVEGELRTLPADTDKGAAAYRMRAHRIYPYQE